MNWKYQREKKLDWADIALLIRETVSMDDVMDIYTPEISRRNHRCPCPFHNGKDYNLSYNKTGYHCFVCGVNGDVISFVKDIRDMSTRADAMRLIINDLHLNIPVGGTINYAQNAEIEKRRADARARQKAKDDWMERYRTLTDAWIQNDRIKRESEPMSDAWAEAVKQLEIISNELDSLPEEPR